MLARIEILPMGTTSLQIRVEHTIRGSRKIRSDKYQ